MGTTCYKQEGPWALPWRRRGPGMAPGTHSSHILSKQKHRKEHWVRWTSHASPCSPIASACSAVSPAFAQPVSLKQGGEAQGCTVKHLAYSRLCRGGMARSSATDPSCCSLATGPGCQQLVTQVLNRISPLAFHQRDPESACHPVVGTKQREREKSCDIET